MSANARHSAREPHDAFSLLRSSFVKWQLPADLLDEIVERHIRISFEKGALVFCEGNTDGLVACILSGYIKVCCPAGDASRTLVRIAGPGDLIGYPDFIDEKGRHARLFEAQAACRCAVGLFSREHLAGYLSALPPDELVQLLETLNTAWSQNLQLYVALLNLPFLDRLRLVLSDLASRAGVRDAEGIVLIPEFGHEDLAQMIGCSRPMVSRLLSEMADLRLITRRGKQYVLLDKWDFSCMRFLGRSVEARATPYPDPELF
ncbi:MAG TPA: Crp/Fnr family transcriptional regulator [Candidatus Binataceae bacterium]|nr:Crp/Fnr family transcriptional regulator [Candidatus Binataceae bacterium]